MKPIGLSIKNGGEIMLVHACLNCGKISKNRIAGDDNAYIVTKLLKDQNYKACRNIKLLSLDDKEVVLSALYGSDYARSLRL